MYRMAEKINSFLKLVILLAAAGTCDICDFAFDKFDSYWSHVSCEHCEHESAGLLRPVRGAERLLSME